MRTKKLYKQQRVTTIRCFYCKKFRGVRLCKACRHFICGWEDCPGSPCPKGESLSESSN